MVQITPDNYINVRNGRFDSTAKSDLDRLVSKFKENGSGKMIVHFHGGLVSERGGMETAERLLREYDDVAYPVFFVWEAGPFEAIRNNLGEIFKERIFQRLLSRVLQFATAKAAQDSGTRGTQLEVEDISAVASQVSAVASQVDHPIATEADEPFSDVTHDEFPEDAHLETVEEQQFQRELRLDTVITAETAKIAAGMRDHDEIESEATRGLTVRASTHTLMSPEVIEAIRRGTPDESERGVATTIRIVGGSVRVLARVIRRMAANRDHGIYPTVVEELLREFYLGNLAKNVWELMKKDTADAFGPDHNRFGGSSFLQALADRWAAGDRPSVTLVGHSTGAIFIQHLLAKADAILAPEFKFDVIYLAPAITVQEFAKTVERYGDRIRNFRSFTMQDSAEQKDRLLGLAYPRSLLYFISGVLEDRADEPLLGMMRFAQNNATFPLADFPEIDTAARFLGRYGNHTVLSPVGDGGDGLNSMSTSHGTFDNDIPTLTSIRHVVASGF